ncbi:MAG TPA: class I SAM-dependent methyltransferase [Prolixibacteraceae bacterium]|nr:class I SAM-dependent methyltransferase [Prolixibacteraceae bacterium]
MGFYQSVHMHYDEMFPLNGQQTVFVNEELSVGSQLLDIGCGTGNLAISLANEGFNVKAIDLDESMIRVAKQKSRDNNPAFRVMNMLNIASEFRFEQFDGILCFGNTIVHLTDNALIEHFLNSVYSILKPGGKFMLQILNYESILEKRPESLPLIENDNIRFERLYEYPGSGFINFKTNLTIKESGETIQNVIPLNPVRKTEIEKMLNETGFRNIRFFGNFKKDKLTSESLPLVMRCEK